MVGSRDGDSPVGSGDPGAWLRPATADGGLTIANEFSRVRLRVDRDGNDVRLAVRSLRTGREVYFDALQLESLTWLDESAYRSLLAEPFGPQ